MSVFFCQWYISWLISKTSLASGLFITFSLAVIVSGSFCRQVPLYFLLPFTVECHCIFWYLVPLYFVVLSTIECHFILWYFLTSSAIICSGTLYHPVPLYFLLRCTIECRYIFRYFLQSSAIVFSGTFTVECRICWYILLSSVIFSGTFNHRVPLCFLVLPVIQCPVFIPIVRCCSRHNWKNVFFLPTLIDVTLVSRGICSFPVWEKTCQCFNDA